MKIQDKQLNCAEKDDLVDGALYYVETHLKRSFPLSLFANESVFIGSTDDEFGRVTDMWVGAREISGDGARCGDTVAFIVSLMHETAGHGMQIEKQFHCDDELSKILSMNHFACKASSEYYNPYRPHRYLYHPREIAAQYAGIVVGCDFLQDYYDSEMANDMICGYVNDRISKKSEFIKNGFLQRYHDVNDILQSFQTVFDRRVYEHRSLNRRVAMRQNGAYTDYFRQNPDSIHQTYISMCQNGVKQDLMLSSIYFYQEDMNDRYRSIYKSLEDVPYSPAAAMDPDYYPAWIQYQDKDLKLSQLLTIDDQDEESTDNELSF